MACVAGGGLSLNFLRILTGPVRPLIGLLRVLKFALLGKASKTPPAVEVFLGTLGHREANNISTMPSGLTTKNVHGFGLRG